MPLLQWETVCLLGNCNGFHCHRQCHWHIEVLLKEIKEEVKQTLIILSVHIAFVWCGVTVLHHCHLCNCWLTKECFRLIFMHSVMIICSFIYSFHWHVQNSCHPSPPTILPSSLTPSCHILIQWWSKSLKYWHYHVTELKNEPTNNTS